MEEASALLPHVVVFPFPGQGHIIPGLQFAQLLASLCKVTFVNTSHNIAKLRASHLDLGPRIRLRALADDGQPLHGPDMFPRIEIMGGLLESLLLNLLQRNTHDHGSKAGLIHGEEKEKDEEKACGGDCTRRDDCSKGSHEAVEEEKAEEAGGSSSFNDIQKADGDNHTHTNDCTQSFHEAVAGDGKWSPPVCIISDMFLGWVQDIADKFNIPRFVLYTASPASLVLMLSVPEMLRQGRLPCHNALDEARMQPLNLPGLTQTLCLDDVPWDLLLPPSAFMFNYFIRQSKRIPDAAAILLNSYYDLQSCVLGTSARCPLASLHRLLSVPLWMELHLGSHLRWCHCVGLALICRAKDELQIFGG